LVASSDDDQGANFALHLINCSPNKTKKGGVDPLATILMATIDESDNECCWQRQGGWPFFFVFKKKKKQDGANEYIYCNLHWRWQML
jgi:hypothetical protein